MNFVQATSNNNWFEKHPEKIAGVEFTTTSIFFPIQVKGTKEDVLRVTGMSEKVGEKQVKVGEKKSVISVPVISYKANGNDIIKIKRKIKPYKNFNNLYLQEKADKNGNYKAVLKVAKSNKVAYFVEGSYSLENFKLITQELIDNRIDRFFNDIKIDTKPRYVRNLEIEIAKELGIDTKPLEKLKEQFLSEKDKINEAQRLKNLQIEKEAEAYEKEQAEKELLQVEKDLLNEKYVDGDLIIDLAKKYDIKIHIRTIGAIRKNNVSFKLEKGEKRNSLSYSFTRKRGKPGYKLSDPSFFYELVDLLENKISDKEWKELTTPKNSLKSEKGSNLKPSAKDLTYEEWKTESKKWDDFIDELSRKVNSVSEKGEMGLSKRTPEFIKAKKEYDKAFKQYQNFNKSTPKGFARKKFNEKIEAANQNHKQKRIRLAKAKAKAIKIKLLLNESI